SQAERERGRHEQLAQVVDVAREAPESADQHALVAAQKRALRQRTERGSLWLGLEVELLQVRSPRQSPAREEQRRAREQQDRRRMRIREVGGVPEADAVEERIEHETAPAELQAHAFGDEVIGVEVHALEEQILDEEEAEERGVQHHAGRWI